MSADARGNTCVHTLPGNTAALVVSELMGAGSYQVKPSESVYFAGGKVANASIEEEACGCPVAPAGIERAQMEKPSSAVTAEKTTPPVNSAPPPAPPNNVDGAALGEMHGSETRPVPPTTPGEVQVQVEMGSYCDLNCACCCRTGRRAAITSNSA